MHAAPQQQLSCYLLQAVDRLGLPGPMTSIRCSQPAAPQSAFACWGTNYSVDCNQGLQPRCTTLCVELCDAPCTASEPLHGQGGQSTLQPSSKCLPCSMLGDTDPGASTPAARLCRCCTPSLLLLPKLWAICAAQHTPYLMCLQLLQLNCSRARLVAPSAPPPHAMLKGCTYGFSTLETHEKGGQVTPSSYFSHSACSFYDFDAPIYTMSRFLPPSKVADAEISDSILGDGTVIRAGCNIKHSVIGLRTLINENCTVEDALVSHAVETCC